MFWNNTKKQNVCTPVHPSYLSILSLALQLVDEFLGSQRVAMAPQTFHMGSLLQEMREIEESEVKFVPQRGIDIAKTCPCNINQRFV